MLVPSAYVAALLSLAVSRVVLLITQDVILDGPRDRLTEWALVRDHDHLAYLITCPWCVGWWVALATWTAWLAAPGATTFIAVPLAVSMAASFAASRA